MWSATSCSRAAGWRAGAASRGRSRASCSHVVSSGGSVRPVGRPGGSGLPRHFLPHGGECGGSFGGRAGGGEDRAVQGADAGTGDGVDAGADRGQVLHHPDVVGALGSAARQHQADPGSPPGRPVPGGGPAGRRRLLRPAVGAPVGVRPGGRRPPCRGREVREAGHARAAGVVPGPRLPPGPGAYAAGTGPVPARAARSRRVRAAAACSVTTRSTKCLAVPVRGVHHPCRRRTRAAAVSVGRGGRAPPGRAHSSTAVAATALSGPAGGARRAPGRCPGSRRPAAAGPAPSWRSPRRGGR